MRASSRQYIAFGFSFLLLAACFHRPLLDALRLALHSDEYTQILLVFPISAALIVVEWTSLTTSPTWDFRSGTAVVAAGLLMALGSHLWLTSDIQLFASVLALVLLWIGAFVFCFGLGTANSILFPLCFLLLMAPFPSLVLSRLVHWLQQGSAFATWLLLSAANVPTVRDGVQLMIPGLTIEVATECSSIRSSLMLVVTTMVLAHLLLRTRWRKILVVLFAIPISVAKNGLRIFTIAMLGTRVDRGFLSGRLHHEGGIVFFLIALVAVLLVITFFRRRETAVRLAGGLSPVRP